MQWKIGILFPCLFCFTYFLFYCVGIIILCTCNGEKMVKRTLYVRKAGARKLFISKDYPSVKTQMVFSDYVKCRILVLRLQGNYPLTISRLPQSDRKRVSWQIKLRNTSLLNLLEPCIYAYIHAVRVICVWSVFFT